MLKYLAAALALTIAAPASAETIYYDAGGVIGTYLEKAKALPSVEIRGQCYSACTLLLNTKEVCVSRRAELHFHLPKVMQSDGTVRVAREFEGWVMAQYPEPIRDLIDAYGGLDEELLTIPGSAVIDFAGFDDCDEVSLKVPPKLWFEGSLFDTMAAKRLETVSPE